MWSDCVQHAHMNAFSVCAQQIHSLCITHTHTHTQHVTITHCFPPNTVSLEICVKLKEILALFTSERLKIIEIGNWSFKVFSKCLEHSKWFFWCFVSEVAAVWFKSNVWFHTWCSSQSAKLSLISSLFHHAHVDAVTFQTCLNMFRSHSKCLQLSELTNLVYFWNNTICTLQYLLINWMSSFLMFFLCVQFLPR